MSRARFLVPLLLAAAALPASAEVLPSDIAVVDDTDGKITEQVSTPNGYLAMATKKFYLTHADLYDAVFVFSAVDISGMLTNVQQGWPVRNDTKGIGRDLLYNKTADFGSRGRLRQAVKMGDIRTLNDDPDKTYTGLLFFDGLTCIELMAHEFGHHWMASIKFKTEDGVTHCLDRAWEGSSEPQPGEILCDGWSEQGYNQHWSYFFNSKSLMYGMFYEETSPGNFKMWYDVPKFSELDQYLMGLRGPGEVPPLFALNGPDGLPPMGSASMPQRIRYEDAKNVTGQRFDFTITDIIRENGERRPAREPCHWKGVIIVVASKSAPATPKILEKMARYANRWESFYSYATDGRGSFDMTIDGRGYGTDTCPSGNAPPPDQGPEPVPEQVIAEEVPSEDASVAEDGFGPPDWAGIDLGGGEAIAGDEDAAPREVVGGEDGATTGEIPAGGICVPGARKCDGNSVRECSPDGMSWGLVRNCADLGMVCTGQGACVEKEKTSGSCDAGHRPASPSWLLVLLPLAAWSLRRRTV